MTKLKGFFMGITKINNVFLIVIVAVYLFVCGALTLINTDPKTEIVEGSKESYVVSGIGETVNTYQKVISTYVSKATDHDHDGHDHAHGYTSYHYIYSVASIKEGMTARDPKIDLIMESNDNQYVYAVQENVFNTSKRHKYEYPTASGTTNYNIENHQRLRNIGVNSLICSYAWTENMGSGIYEDHKESYSVKLLTLTKDDMKNAIELKDTTASNDLYDLEFKLDGYSNTSTVKGYNYQFKLTPTAETYATDYRINIQAFIETKTGDYLDFCGGYNYYDKAGKPLNLRESASYNYISDSVKADMIYIKVEFYNAKLEKQTQVYSFNYSDLVNIYKGNL